MLPFQTVIDSIVLQKDRGASDKLAWTSDGQILTVGTNAGYVYSFLTKLPVTHSAYGTKIVVCIAHVFLNG